jgi:phosphotransferase system HPr (HPr) family protein
LRFEIRDRKSQIKNRKSTMPKASREIVVVNPLGLHARPAMALVDTANQFGSKILLRKPGDKPVEADGKSVMQVITLEATVGTKLIVEADGDDAEAAVEKINELFRTGFGE